jgi:CCR4-NOT transcription complex subunit 4
MKSKNESIVEAKPAKKEGTMNSKPNTSKPDEPSTTASKTGVASNSGSPMLKQARTIADHHVTSTLESAVAGRGQTNSTENSPRPVDVVAPMDSLSRPTAENHYSAAAKGTKGPAPMQSTVTNENRVLAASTDAIPPTSSRPGTPADVASKTSEASAMRSRTIRVTTVVTPKPDTTTPASAVTEKSGVLPSGLGKQRSRQPSISSISRSRPSTPAVSDHIYSNDVSRASSPPPSIVGSVPERPKAKNQIRKEKKSKAKETTETNSEGPPTPVERKVEEVAPIISRHKKKRKTPDRSTADGGADPAVATEKVDHKMPTASGSTKAAKQQSSKDATPTGSGEHKLAEDVAREAEVGKKSATPVTGKEDKTASNTTLKDPYTLNQLLADSGKTNDPEAFKTLLDEHISNIQTLLSQLFDSKQLDHSSALFNLPPLTSYRLPPDSRRGADYLDGNGYTMSSPFGEVYLDSKQRKELQQGSAVRISDQNRPNDLLKRTLITKGGRVYRHLSQEEEEKVLALERRREEDERMYGELGAKAMLKVDEADFLNIEGGLDELLKHGAKHGISWVMDESEDIDGDLDGEDDTDYPIGDDEPGGLATLAGGWQATGVLATTSAGATSKELAATAAASRHQAQKKSINLRAMDMEKLQRTVREAQIEMEQARKEMEAAEKRYAKKGKEATKWRETMLKGKVIVGPD